MPMSLRYLFPVISKLVYACTMQIKDNRNIYSKGSSARTLINSNSQKAFDLFAYFIFFHELKSSQTPHGLGCKLRLYSHFILMSGYMLVLLEPGTGRNACRPIPLKGSSFIKTYQNLSKPTKNLPNWTLINPIIVSFYILYILHIYSDYVFVFSFKTTLIVIKLPDCNSS